MEKDVQEMAFSVFLDETLWFQLSKEYLTVDHDGALVKILVKEAGDLVPESSNIDRA